MAIKSMSSSGRCWHNGWYRCRSSSSCLRGHLVCVIFACCKRSSFGGEYYGLEVDDCTCLTVPVQGPGSGSSKFSIVRVGESPREWRERLLVNSAVIGVLSDGFSTLSSIATAQAPPIVTACGVIT